MYIDEYKETLVYEAGKLGLIKDKKNNMYYKLVNSQKVYYIRNPHKNNKEGGFEVIEASYINDEDNQVAQNIKRIRAMLTQGLHFTTNPYVAKDSDGNYYDYDKEKGEFVKRI